ncbi:MAG: ATP-binding protein [Bacteroidota bacterium]
MHESPFKKGLFWLILGLLFLLISTALYLYDQDHTDFKILSEVETQLQRDFNTCLAYFSGDSLSGIDGDEFCPSCKLVYDENGKLYSWSNYKMLPAQSFINRLNDFSKEPILNLGSRRYFQTQKNAGDSTEVLFFPLHIPYRVFNSNLIPYFFLGSYRDYFYDSNNEKYLQDLIINFGGEDLAADIRIRDPEGNIIYTLSNVPTIVFRSYIRYSVLAFLLLGAIFLAVYLRIYTLNRAHYRYFINVSLFVGIILIRALMYFLGLPGDYWDLKLFSPDILAFGSSFFAPSLGEMTINVLTIFALAWILYVHMFRLSNLIFRKIVQKHFFAWICMMATLFLSSYLLYEYVAVFSTISTNSQVEIDFTNLFQANIYSFLILLDVGILLLSGTLMIIVLLKVNVFYGRRYGFNAYFLFIHCLALVVFNLYLHKDSEWGWGLAISVALLILVIGYTVQRKPFDEFLHQDIQNYLLITLAFAVLVSHNVFIGQNNSRKEQANEIAKDFKSRKDKTIASFSLIQSKVYTDQAREEILLNWNKKYSDASTFKSWFMAEFMRDQFNDFDPQLFLFDITGEQFDPQKGAEPIVNPFRGVPLEDMGALIAEDLYQIPNDENRYVDVYVGLLNILLGRDSSDMQAVSLTIQLIPTRRETDGLYPSLTLDEEAYEEIQKINAYDHAIYRDDYLHYKRGQSAFPVTFDERSRNLEDAVRMEDGSMQLVEEVGPEKFVFIRYKELDIFEKTSIFSFIFYFYIICALILISLPALILRSLHSPQLRKKLPLRSKIRYGLFAISLLPMFIIIVLLSSFIRNRYYDDASEELRKEAERVTNSVKEEYTNLFEDPYRRITLLRSFSSRVKKMGEVIENDITVYDAEGKSIATTQPLIFDSNINTDLMNDEALKRLAKGKESDLVIEEQIGTLSYLSAYWPVILENENPIGYINVPYLANQNQLDEQVYNFLAYLLNIYLLVFLLINVVAVFLSSTITKPLALVQQRLASTNLGEENELIDWESDDEIGEIVRAYNQMVSQLEESEEKLTQSEREMAWRQMARQVAHEIKNPLTPMKLNIQHLNRAFNESGPRLQKMFPKVMKTLLAQIDSLVRIANSFSEFAKMPEPVNTRILVNDVLHEVVDLYTQSEEAIWLIDIPQDDFWSFADREQLSRCFTNIIKNALQAVNENGIIHVSMKILGDHALIEIKDNGKGMTEEIQKRIFEPSFSTKSSGMGLGLAIVKRIIESANGTITFESEEGVGTTFKIVLPEVRIENMVTITEGAA